MYQAYIFDLDGTLLDTLESLANCYNRALSKHGYPTHEVDAYRYFIGDGAEKCVTRCLPESARKPEIIAELMATQREDYQLTWQAERCALLWHLSATPFAGRKPRSHRGAV